MQRMFASDSEDPFATLNNTSVLRGGGMGNLDLPGLSTMLRNVGIGALVITVMLGAVMIIIGNSKTRDDGKDLIVSRLKLAIVLSASVSLLTLMKRFAESLAGIG